MAFHAIVTDFIVFLLLTPISAYRIMCSTIILLVVTYTHYGLPTITLVDEIVLDTIIQLDCLRNIDIQKY